MVTDGILCGCCHVSGAKPILRTPDSSQNWVTVCHCSNCCALTADYGEEAGSQIDSQVQFHNSFWEPESTADYLTARLGMKSVISFYKDFMPKVGSDHIVYDIGSGRGNLLAALLQEGYNSYGCEPSLFLFERAKEVYGIPNNNLLLGPAEEFLNQKQSDIGKVDVIFLWHVLEHLEEPVMLLQQAAKFLKPNGVIICQGPLLSTKYLYKEHLFFHCESNITWLAKQIKFKLVVMDCYSPERFASFVLAQQTHPNTAIQSVFLDAPLDGTGSLYFSLDTSLRLLKENMLEK
jgi:2-polyprenyl-3-methyl-5-hydroxy-6-metoxy-1,4-benzoquinol methylase